MHLRLGGPSIPARVSTELWWSVMENVMGIYAVAFMMTTINDKCPPLFMCYPSKFVWSLNGISQSGGLTLHRVHASRLKRQRTRVHHNTIISIPYVSRLSQFFDPLCLRKCLLHPLSKWSCRCILAFLRSLYHTPNSY
jgi:hypothetical protein